MEALWPLVRDVAARGAPAWPALATALSPPIMPIARNQPLGRLRASEDTLRVLERLHARSFAAITKLCALADPPALGAWLRVVVRHAAIDFMREAPEYERATPARDARWISLATLVSVPGAQPDTLVAKRDAVLAFLRDAVARADADHAERGDDAIAELAATWSIARIHARRLVQRGGDYVRVLIAVLSGHSYPETAEALDMTRREVELTVQYVEEFLAARRFAI
jgi:DNA-directed RNA polymerase specialized sigma24 family protein